MNENMTSGPEFGQKLLILDSAVAQLGSMSS